MTNAFWTSIKGLEDARNKIVWGAMNDEEFNKTTQKEADFIIKTLSIQPSDIVLDYGCGIGRLMKPISKACFGIVGVDINPEMVRLSKEYLKDVKNCEVLTLNTIIRFNSVSKVYSFIVFQHMSKYEVFLVLKNLTKALLVNGQGLFQFPDLLRNAHTFEGYAVDYVTSTDSECSSMNFWTEQEARFLLDLAGWNVKEVINQETDFWVLCEVKA